MQKAISEVSGIEGGTGSIDIYRGTVVQHSLYKREKRYGRGADQKGESLEN